MRVCFGPFVLDLDARQLTRGRVDVHLTPKALQLLATLVSERPRAVPKAQLMECLWPDTFVVEANLSNLVVELREALDDQSRTPRWIRTAHRFGYAFCGEVANATDEGTPAVPTCWLQWGRQRFPLALGEHLIGRDPDVAIRLDAPSVSRRHAKVVVARDSTWLEDSGSKNGTCCRDEAVTSPVRLLNGDIVRIGALTLTFHANMLPSTDTLAAAQP